MLASVAGRKLVTAFWAPAVTRRNDGPALRALFDWGFAVTIGGVTGSQLVDGSVAQRIAAEVQHQAITLFRVQTEPAADHLVEQTRRKSRAHQRHAVDNRRVEADARMRVRPRR